MVTAKACATILLPGATVTVSGGSGPVASGITGAGGAVSLDIGNAGTYDIAVEPPDLPAFSCPAVALTCGGSSTCNRNYPGYVLCGGKLIKKTLYATAAGKTWPITTTAADCNNGAHWLTAAGNTVTANSVASPANNVGGTCTGAETPIVSGSVNLGIDLTCGTGGGLTAGIGACTYSPPFAHTPALAPAACTCGTGSAANATMAATSIGGTVGPATNLTLTYPGTFPPQGFFETTGAPNPAITVTITS